MHCRKDLAAASNLWASSTPHSMSSGQKDTTRKLETAHRQVFENHHKDLQAVQALELRLGIDQRWQLQGVEWKNVGRMVVMHKYKRALDVLEGLVVACMFELMKMNRSQTGKLVSTFTLTQF
jgi:hypothetical protein